MADFYDTLSAAEQASFRAKLFSQIVPTTCPQVDVSSVKTVDALVDAGNRFVAIACFQQSRRLPAAAGAGALDAQTYAAVMGTISLTKVEKYALFGVAGLVAYQVFARKGRRR